jgi:hypothetical protein
MFRSKSPWLGQVPLVLGPSSWGVGMMPATPPPVYDPQGIQPYWGEWGVVDETTGKYIDSGRVGPFESSDEAFQAAAEEASRHGARRMPLDGFAQVKDSRGQSVGPII